jgi:pimeloyl-ACP methyl ester carboxylesterase
MHDPSRHATSTNLITRDGLRLVADIYLPPGTPRGAAVVAHGFSGSRRAQGVLEQARALRDEGFAVVVHDGRGHGESPGACTLGSDEALDVAAAVERARELSDDVVVVGASMGAISVLRYAADDPDLAGVVAVSGPARWTPPRTPVGLMAAALTQTRAGRAVAKRRMGVTIAPGFSYPAPPVELVTRIAAPLAIVHGTRDRTVPARAAHELYAAATGPRALHVVERMGHAFDKVGRATVTAAARWALGHSSGSLTAPA